MSERDRTEVDDRRRSPRRTLSDIPVITGVTIASEPVVVVNLSAVGVLIECERRLFPRVAGQLEFQGEEGARRVNGRVVRSEVARFDERSVQYRIAIAFETPLDFIDRAAPAGAPGPPISDFAAPALAVDDVDGSLERRFMVNAWTA
jgi:hypothetical protein